VEQVDEHRARRLWRALEPYHAVVYFAPEPQAACTELGTRGYWMSYFALRAAPLGAAPPELIAALFYGFAPRLVARAVPDAWRVAAPERFLAVRLEAVDAALHRLLGAETLRSAEVAQAAGLAREAALAAPTAGRAMAAANAALPWPEPPHLVLWHAQTVLREQRGDGHVAALLTAGLDPVESLALHAAAYKPPGQRSRILRALCIWSSRPSSAKLTSSINCFIRKIPRPLAFRTLSLSSGFATPTRSNPRPGSRTTMRTSPSSWQVTQQRTDFVVSPWQP